MTQTGANETLALYHCTCCGNNMSVAISAEQNTDYLAKKLELLSRTYRGITEWETTQWDYLRKDIADFMARYEDSKSDMRIHMALLACITHGFHYITEKNYKECKSIYKLSLKLYKCTLRSLKEKPNARTTEQVSEYEKNRALYKKCRNDYRNTKVAWKIAFTLFKKLLLR